MMINNIKVKKTKKKEDFPQISVSVSIVKNTNKPMSYTNIISKTKEQVLIAEKVQINKMYQAQLDAEQRRKESEEREKLRKNNIPIPRSKPVFSKISWADAESSEDEEDYYIHDTKLSHSTAFDYNDNSDEDW